MAQQPQQQPHDDLADLLYAADDAAPGRNHRGDDLLSQMAGDSIDRMMSGEFDPIVNPVEKLTDQLDTFFEQLQHRRQMKSIAPQAIASSPAAPPAIETSTAPDEEQFEFDADERRALEAAGADVAPTGSLGLDSPAPARAMLVDDADEFSEPAYLKPVDWMAAPIESMSPAGRVVVSLMSVASFLGACATLAWVLVLRQGQ